MAIKKVRSSDSELKWEVRVYEGGRGSRRIRRRFSKRIEAEKFLFEWESEQKQRETSPYRECSFENRKFKDESDYWLRDSEHRFSPGYLKKVKGILAEIWPKFGELTLDKFTPDLLARYQQSEKARGLENPTVNKKTQVITGVLNFSARQRRIPFNPATGFRKLNWIKPEMSFWGEKEALDFLDFTDDRYRHGDVDRWVYVVYLLAINTGLRAGEIWGLKPIDICQDGKTILIRRQLNGVSNDFGPTKGKNQRMVPCNELVYAELKDLIRFKRISDNETIFMNESRKPICHGNFFDRRFLKDMEAWGGRRIRFHDLRHTATTLLLSSGVDIKTVKEICGHSNIGTTMIYAHLIPGSVAKVASTFSIVPRKEKKSEGD